MTTETKQALDAVVALVVKWREQAGPALRRSGTWTGNDLADRIEDCSNELADLLPHLHAYIHRIQTSHPSYDNAVRIRQLEEQVEQLQAALGEAGKDSERLDALEAEVASGGSLTLHNGEGANGGRGLGLSNTGRTLRQAIDQCCGLDAMAAGEDAK